MPFTTGQLIVHPFHGPATVSSLQARTVKGRSVAYLDLTPVTGNLRVSVPTESAERVGLRPLMTLGEAAELMSELRADSPPRERNWSRRVKDYKFHLQTGSTNDRAFVVREILRGCGPHPHNLAERDLLRAAGEPLVAELQLTLEISEEAAWQLLEVAALPELHPLRDPAAELLEGGSIEHALIA